MINCRNCEKDIIDGIDYYGFCSPSCQADFARRNNLIFNHVKEFSYEEIEYLENKIDRLEEDVSYYSTEEQRAQYEIDDLRKDLKEQYYKMVELEKKLDELKNLDWEKIKIEREDEKRKNDTIISESEVTRKMNVRLAKENLSLFNTNKELVNALKDMDRLSDRFQLMDLDYE